MDFNQLQELIRLVGKQKFAEFIYKEGDFKIVIRHEAAHTESAGQVTPLVIPASAPVVTLPAAAPTTSAPAAPPPTASAPAPAPAAPETGITIKSPMVGTFYRSAGPDKPPFVKVGDEIQAGSTVCIIEAMKLFNEIESDVRGKIIKVLVEDATPVEYDQPLFLVEPA